VRGAIPIDPVSAEISGKSNQFFEGPRLYRIAVCAVPIAGRQIRRIIRCGKDNDRDRSQAVIGSQPAEKLVTVLFLKMPIQQNDGGET
jgi:hypothetical protein